MIILKVIKACVQLFFSYYSSVVLISLSLFPLDDGVLATPMLHTSQPYVSIGLGYGISNVGKNNTIPTNFDSSNEYQAPSVAAIAPLFSVGAGFNHDISANLQMQWGISINHLNALTVTGAIAEDGAPATDHYQYKVNSNALMGDFALIYHPQQNAMTNIYARVSLGVSQNKAWSYQRINSPGDLSPSLRFANHTQTEFAYRVGVGILFALSPHWLAGPEYSYWNLGKVSLGKGKNVAGQARGPLQGGNLNVHSILVFRLLYQF